MNRTPFGESSSIDNTSQVIERIVETLLEPACRADGWEMPVADEWRLRLRATCRDLREASMLMRSVDAPRTGMVCAPRS